MSKLLGPHDEDLGKYEAYFQRKNALFKLCVRGWGALEWLMLRCDLLQYSAMSITPIFHRHVGI